MPRTIPFPTKPKEKPEETEQAVPTPEETDLVSEELDVTPEIEETPEESELLEEQPEETPVLEETPDPSELNKEQPTDLNMENVVYIGGKPVEIKPTKLKYFRNQTTSCYGYLKVIPLTEFLTYDKGVLNKTKDADQLLFDFLIAVFDDSDFVRDNYDEISADEVEQIIKIFGRINHIDEKEEAARKNRQAQGNR